MKTRERTPVTNATSDEFESIVTHSLADTAKQGNEIIKQATPGRQSPEQQPGDTYGAIADRYIDTYVGAIEADARGALKARLTQRIANFGARTNDELVAGYVGLIDELKAYPESSTQEASREAGVSDESISAVRLRGRAALGLPGALVKKVAANTFGRLKMFQEDSTRFKGRFAGMAARGKYNSRIRRHEQETDAEYYTRMRANTKTTIALGAAGLGAASSVLVAGAGLGLGAAYGARVASKAAIGTGSSVLRNRQEVPENKKKGKELFKDIAKQTGVAAIGGVAAASALNFFGGASKEVLMRNDKVRLLANFALGGRGGGDGGYISNDLRNLPGGRPKVVTHPGGMGFMPGEVSHQQTLETGVRNLNKATGATPEKDTIFAHSQGTLIAAEQIERNGGTGGNKYVLYGGPTTPGMRLADDPLYRMAEPIAKGAFGIDVDKNTDLKGVHHVVHKDDMVTGVRS